MKKILFVLTLLFGSSVYAQMPKIEFEEYKLDNGLTVLLHEDHSTPIVAVSVMYHVGAKNENPERTGFAHFFEHLLFEGFAILKEVNSLNTSKMLEEITMPIPQMIEHFITKFYHPIN